MKAVFLDKLTISDNVDFGVITKLTEQLSSHSTTSPEQVVTRSLDADIILTNKVVITAEHMRQLPKLKLICITATGMNNVDLEAAKALGITVKNVSGYSTNSVSQYVFSMLLNVYNQPQAYCDDNKNGQWPQSKTFCLVNKPITELAGKTLGIIGYGDIGKQVAVIAKVFGMKVLIAERLGAESVRAERQPMAEVLAQSDVVSLHCPLTDDTKKLINAKTLNQMKPGAILINTARGPLIDNIALIEALKSKLLSHAILDVLDIEPPPQDHPLITANLDNLHLTAHIAWASNEAQQRLIDGVARNIQRFIDNR